MPAAIDPVIKKQVVKQWLLGHSRDRIAADNGIGAGTVSNIIDDFKKGVQDTDLSPVRELAIHCKKEDVDQRDLRSALRIKNHYDRLTQLGTNVSEEQVEAYIANLASSPDPAKLIEAAAQISESGIPLEKLEEHVKTLQLIDLGSMSKENNGKDCSLLKKSSTGTIGIKEFSAGDPISRERLGTVLVGLLSNELMRKRNISGISYARDACTMIVKSYLAKIKTIRMSNWPLKILRLFLIRSLEYHLESRSVSHF